MKLLIKNRVEYVLYTLMGVFTIKPLLYVDFLLE